MEKSCKMDTFDSRLLVDFPASPQPRKHLKNREQPRADNPDFPFLAAGTVAWEHNYAKTNETQAEDRIGGSDAPGNPSGESGSHVVLGEDEHVVERVLEYRQWQGIRHAKVKWLGHSKTQWIPADAIFYIGPAQKRKTREGESVLGTRGKNFGIEYKIRWKGRGKNEDSWIPEDKVLKRRDILDIVNAFLKSQGEPSLPDTLVESTVDHEPPLRQTVSLGHELSGPAPETMPERMAVSYSVESDIQGRLLEIVRKPVSQWSEEDVFFYLSSKGFSDAALLLRKGNVNAKELAQMQSAGTMRNKYHVVMGHGLKILNLIRNVLPGEQKQADLSFNSGM